NLVGTESLFNVCVITAVLFAATTPSILGQCLSGALLGMARLVRPPGFLYLPRGLLPACRRRLLPVSLRLKAGLVITLLAIAPSLAWAAHNRAVGEGFRVSSVSEIGLLFYQAAYAISEQQGQDWHQSWETRVDELANRLASRLRPGEDVLSA